MTSHSLSRLDEADVILALDASVVINLLGTGMAAQIIGALGRKCIVERNAWREVTKDPLTRNVGGRTTWSTYGCWSPGAAGDAR